MIEKMGMHEGKNNPGMDVITKAVEDLRVEQKSQERTTFRSGGVDLIMTEDMVREKQEKMIKQQCHEIMQRAVIDHYKQNRADEELIESLDREEMKLLRLNRIKELQRKKDLLKEWKSKNHGTVTSVVDQAEFFNHVKESKFVVCTFFKSANKWCDKLREIMKVVAPHHLETRFLEMEGEKAPFLCQRLNIFMMPTVVLCKDNKVDRQCAGLDPFNPTGELTAELVETRLAEWGFVIETHLDAPKRKDKGKSVFASNIAMDSDSDLDL